LRQPLVALNLWCDRQPQQLGAVEQSDGDNLSGQAPGSDRRRRRLRPELPKPAQVSWMQLHRRVGVLPLPQNAHNIAQLADGRTAQLNSHARDHTTMPAVRTWFTGSGHQTVCLDDRPFDRLVPPQYAARKRIPAKLIKPISTSSHHEIVVESRSAIEVRAHVDGGGLGSCRS